MKFHFPSWLAQTQTPYRLMRPKYRASLIAGWFPHTSRGGSFLWDIGPRCHHASFTVAPTGVATPVGWAFSYDGSNDYLTIAHDALLNPSRITIVGIFKLTGVPGNFSTIFQKDTDGNWHNGYGLWYGNGNVKFYYGKGTVPDPWERSAEAALSSANRDWHCVVATYDGTTRRIWLDGVPGNSDSTAFSDVDSSDTAFIGAGHGAGTYIPGILGPLLVFNEAHDELFRNPLGCVFSSPPDINLKVIPAGTSTVRLTWTDNSEHETGFSIERSTTSATAGFSEIDTVGAGVTTYDDAGLAADTYWYRVRALNATKGNSEWAYSNEVTV